MTPAMWADPGIVPFSDCELIQFSVLFDIFHDAIIFKVHSRARSAAAAATTTVTLLSEYNQDGAIILPIVGKDGPAIYPGMHFHQDESR